jgi:hypothetical protein
LSPGTKKPLTLHDIDRAYGDAQNVIGWIGMMLGVYGEGARDRVFHECAGVQTPQAWWEQLNREANSYVPSPAPALAPSGSVLCDPVVPGMPIICRPFPSQ